MVDKACGVPESPRRSFDAHRVAEEIIGHIDTMYPAMWTGVTKNARRSLRGCIVNEINAEFKRLQSE